MMTWGLSVSEVRFRLNTFGNLLLCLSLFVVTLSLTQWVHADVVVVLSEHSFEPGAVEMDFFGTYGDQDASFYGLAATNPRTGAEHFWGDFGSNGGGLGFAGNYSGVTVGTMNFGPLEYGAVFDVQAYVALDQSDPATNGFFDVVLNFFDAGDNQILTALAASAYDTSSFSSNYSLTSLQYTLNATDLPDLASVSRVEATLNLDSNSNTADGRVFVDDFSFTYTTAVPEPGSASLIMLLGFGGILTRRRSK